MRSSLLGLLAVTFAYSAAAQEGMTIPAEKRDARKIYVSKGREFRSPAVVDCEKVMKATPEYREIQRKNLEEGTARYWHLMQDGSKRVIRAILSVGEESEHDLICAKGYLEEAVPEAGPEDITERVIEVMKDQARRLGLGGDTGETDMVIAPGDGRVTSVRRGAGGLYSVELQMREGSTLRLNDLADLTVTEGSRIATGDAVGRTGSSSDKVNQKSRTFTFDSSDVRPK